MPLRRHRARAGGAPPHTKQTVYHGPVAYVDDAVRRLERATSDLHLPLLLVFVKEPEHRGQRELLRSATRHADSLLPDLRRRPSLAACRVRSQIPLPARIGVPSRPV